MNHQKKFARAPRAVRIGVSRFGFRLAISAGIALLSGLAGVLASGPAQAQVPTVSGSEWAVSGRFGEDKDLSGLDCLPGNFSACVVASDEGVSVQAFSLDLGARRVSAGAELALLKGRHEGDFEAVAATKDGFFVTGSHGLTRSKGEYRTSRFNVFKLKQGPNGLVSESCCSLLGSMLETDPVFAPYVRERLQQNGVNIEGLAVKGDRLFFGFRGPSLNGQAFILEVTEEALFSAGPSGVFMPTESYGARAPRYQVHKLPLGEGQGIRGLASVSDGFLILSGDTAVSSGQTREGMRVRSLFSAGNPAALYHWDGRGASVRKLAVLKPVSSGAAPEGVLVLDEGAQSYRLLIVSDGRSASFAEYSVPR